MKNNTKRPKFLNLLKIRLPITGIISIAHRFSGVLLFLLTPLIIYALDLSLRDEKGFQQVQALWSSISFRVVFFVVLWAFLHHLIAGIRFLLLDIDVGVQRNSARGTAWGVMVLAFSVTIILVRTLW